MRIVELNANSTPEGSRLVGSGEFGKLRREQLFAFGIVALIFVEHLQYILTNLRLMNLFYAVGAVLVASKLVTSTLKLNAAAGLCAYLALITAFFFYGVLVNNSVSVSGQQAVYYLKPVLFFLLGYFFFTEKLFSRLIEFVWWLSLFGTVVFYVFPKKLIDLAASHLNLATFGFYEAFGLISRNISWYVSPLEFGALCMFLAFYVIEYRPNPWRWRLLITIAMACSTFARSVILAGVAAYLLSKLRLTARNFAVLAAIILCLVGTIFYFDEFFLQYFVNDGSASVHNQILKDSIELILKHPWGLGIGASGWAGYDEALHWYFYSEGTVGMVLIEIGWVAIPLFTLLSISAFRVSRNFGLLCVSFLIACLMVPIGVSTFFICLFFLFFGMKIKGRPCLA